MNKYNLVEALKKIANWETVLHIASHPDDEDIGMLVYLRKKHNCKVVYWSATRGEKGKNAITEYQNEEFGIYRMLEGYAVASHADTIYMYGSFIDFGYCEDSDTAFCRWNGVESINQIDWENEALCSEIVQVIRSVKPTIVISRWKGVQTDLHGHHKAVGIATKKAFILAAEPKFTNKLDVKKDPPWRPLQFYCSEDNSNGNYQSGGALNFFGKRNYELERKNCLRINTGEKAPGAEESPQDIAWKAFKEYESQQVGGFATKGDFYYYYSLISSRIPKEDCGFRQSINSRLMDLVQLLELNTKNHTHYLAKIDDYLLHLIESIKDRNEMPPIEKTMQVLVYFNEALEALHMDGDIKDDNVILINLIREKKIDLEKVLLDLLGVTLVVQSLDGHPKIGSDFNFSMILTSDYAFDTQDLAKGCFLRYGNDHSANININVGLKPTDSAEGNKEKIIFSGKISRDQIDHIPHTTPKWPYIKRSHGRYLLSKIGNEALISELAVEIEMTIFEQKLTIAAPIFVENHLTTKQPALFLPCYTFAIKKDYYLSKAVSNHKICGFLERRYAQQSFHGSLFITDTLLGDTHEISVSTSKEPNEQISIELLQGKNLSTGSHSFDLKFKIANEVYSNRLTWVERGSRTDCKRIYLLPPASINIHVFDVVMPIHKKIGYISGSSLDQTIEILRSLLFDVKELPDFKSLDDFKTIVIGPDAYRIRYDLKQSNATIMNFIRNGGTLIVQHQHYEYASQAPYSVSYAMPHQRVSDPNAPIEILVKGHEIFTTPNEIDQLDFNGWEHERGQYFWKSWDERYQALISCAKGGEVLKGGLLSCSYGKGKYIYLGYSIYKEVQNGHNGAMKLLSNILSY